ncbi:MAG TPA: hypothetical protein VFC18_03540 [Burkholderiales bacterium]|nr:hypothetical protein [Burkholderiales bacterium]
MKPSVLLLALSLAALPAAASYDANGVPLGAHERQVKQRYPSAYCKALEWSSLAADRRCDDSRADFAGVRARITFYLKNDAVQAFDVRFDSKQLQRLMPTLREKYGKPDVESEDPERRFFRAEWKTKTDRAVLVSDLEKHRASLLVSRGNFEEEIYRVR